jgi:type II secretory pathway component PulF
VLNVVPLIGSSLRYGCAADAARTMAVLIEAGRTPAEALRLAASQCDYAVTAAGWSAAARAAERGREPALALVGRRGVPPSLAGALAQAPAPSWPAVLRTMADVYAAKGRHRAGLARMILGPMILVVAVGVVLWSYMELQLGLGMLINRLTM